MSVFDPLAPHRILEQMNMVMAEEVWTQAVQAQGDQTHLRT
jgi:hypothetical protein